MTLGFLEDKADPGDIVRDENRYVLALLPYEQTTTYGQGVGRAPEAIVQASSHVELFDEVLEVDASRHGILTVRPSITDLASVTRAARKLREEHPHSLIGFVGGEHSLTPALVEAFAPPATGSKPNLGIVWIDAHADLRQEFHGREDNHACAGHNSMRFGPIVQVGIRTLAEEEWSLLKKTDRVRAHRHWNKKARADLLALPRDVYLTVDFDGFSPEVIRAVGTPEPGGLYWEEVMDILDTVFRHKNVVAFDAVELAPNDADIASSFTAARLVYKVMNYHAAYTLGDRRKKAHRATSSSARKKHRRLPRKPKRRARTARARRSRRRTKARSTRMRTTSTAR
ncbi:MAG TPA: arginase family protein [Candidatus Krumholzibacteria bacterium]|nr:arginase family protein [Candidatus Krumholzibacteria bacterium]